MTTVPTADGPEKGVLSMMLRERAFIARAKSEGLTPEHFASPGRAELFRQIVANPEAAADLVGFTNDLERKGVLDRIGGASELTECLTYAPGGHHFGNHIRILRETFARRQLLTDAMRIVDEVSGAEPDEITRMANKAAERAAEALEAGSPLWDAKRGVRAVTEQMRAITDHEQDSAGISTGMTPIDLVTNGLGRGQLWVVAGETSGGKSVFLLQVAAEVLAAGKIVFVSSLEMQGPEVFQRLASCHGAVPVQTFTRPREANPHNLKRAKTALQEVAGWRIVVDDRGGRSVSEISGTAETAATMEGGIDLVVVDYLQLVKGTRQRGDSREREVADVSSSLKALAKSLNCPVLTASQLNDNGRLRESRAIGQDADVVLKITDDGIVGEKVRNGPRNQLFKLTLNGEIQRFQPV